jgi:hypothetical protein
MEGVFRARILGKAMILKGIFILRVEQKIFSMGRDRRFGRTGSCALLKEPARA